MWRIKVSIKRRQTAHIFAVGAACFSDTLLKSYQLGGKGILGFYSKNRPEWVIAEQGCFSQSIIPVPSYDTLGADSIAYAVGLVGLNTVLHRRVDRWDTPGHPGLVGPRGRL